LIRSGTARDRRGTPHTDRGGRAARHPARRMPTHPPDISHDTPGIDAAGVSDDEPRISAPHRSAQSFHGEMEVAGDEDRAVTSGPPDSLKPRVRRTGKESKQQRPHRAQRARHAVSAVTVARNTQNVSRCERVTSQTSKPAPCTSPAKSPRGWVILGDSIDPTLFCQDAGERTTARWCQRLRRVSIAGQVYSPPPRRVCVDATCRTTAWAAERAARRRR
jgi:hypothetical protein